MFRLSKEPNQHAKTTLECSTFIRATPTQLWKVLTRPEYTIQYCDGYFAGSWTEGSCLEFVEGNKKIAVDILELVPGVLLKSRWHYPAALEKHFQILPVSTGVELRFICSGFTDGEGDYHLRCEHNRIMLQKIKWIAEFAMMICKS